MAATATRITVSTTATLIATGDVAGTSVVVRIPAGGNTVTIGGSDSVTTSNGFDLVSGESLSVELDSGEQLYGIVAASTQVVHTVANHVNSTGAYPYS